MKPSLGRTVLFRLDAQEPDINGSRIHPAVITRVHGPSCVNLKVLTDGPEDLWRTSVTFLQEDNGEDFVCFFPPRV